MSEKDRRIHELENVKEIVKEYLERNGFDGLWFSDGCGCCIEDLMPCDGNVSLCEPGYKQIIDGDWIIGPNKVGSNEDNKL